MGDVNSAMGHISPCDGAEASLHCPRNPVSRHQEWVSTQKTSHEVLCRRWRLMLDLLLSVQSKKGVTAKSAMSSHTREAPSPERRGLP